MSAPAEQTGRRGAACATEDSRRLRPRPAARRRALAALGAAMLAVVLTGGCTLQLPAPHLEVTAEPAYNRRNILIPYQLQGVGTYAQAQWSLQRYSPGFGEWELLNSGQIRVPNGTSGILQLELDDGRYQLEAQLLTSRGGISATAPSLTRTQEFFVDTQPPDEGINLSPEPSDAAVTTAALTVSASYAGTTDPDRETPVHLYYLLDSTETPTADLEPAGDTIVLWDGGAASYSRVLSIIAIDEAGNAGTHRIESYTAP